VKISFDGIIMQLQPDAVNWEPPRVIARDGEFAPVRGKFWSCRLSLGKTVVPSLHDWQRIFDDNLHTAILPHPFTGDMTSFCCYVDAITPRMDTGDQQSHCAAVAGFDVQLARIDITEISWDFSFSFCTI
jgi:hypothetical protein